MGRLLAIALAVAAAGIAVVAVNGPGIDKPEEPEAGAPAQRSSTVSTEAPDEPVAPSGKPGDRAPRAGATVRMKGLRFRPGAVSVEVGQAVRFVNDDDVAHTVFQDLGPRSGLTPVVDSRRIPPGERFEFVPRSNGLVAFVCTLHPAVMIGQVLVEKPAA